MVKNLGKLLKEAGKIREQISRIQEELSNRRVEATAGGGMVKAVVNGNQEIVSLQIEKEVVDPEDIEMLESLIIAAVNEAIRKSRQILMEELTLSLIHISEPTRPY